MSTAIRFCLPWTGSVDKIPCSHHLEKTARLLDVVPTPGAGRSAGFFAPPAHPGGPSRRWSMRSATWFLPAAVLLLLLGELCTLEARRAPRRRQYYDTTWKYQRDKKYYTKTYHYRPKRSVTKYRHQYVIYKPMKSKSWVYWYNPEKKKYWARCPTKYHPTYGARVKAGKDYWSTLPEAKKKHNLDDVSDDDWGKVQENSPPVPGSDDGATIQCPPSDLPPG
jgi:hypothetical protein